MIDNYFINLFITLENDFIVFLMKIFSFLGSIYSITIILLVFYLLNKNKWSTFLIKHTVIICIINNILKIIVRRVRPEYMLVDESFYSFPSGHAMVGTFVFGFLIWYIYKQTKLTKKYKISIISILTLILFLICFSRIYLMVHYFSDVVVGIIIALIYLKVVLKNISKKS